MKNLFKKIIAVLAVVCMIGSAVPAVSAVNDDEYGNSLLYGRKQLLKLNNSEALAEAYDRIVECVENRDTAVSLSDLYINRDEIITVVTAYRNDPHGHFWLGNTYSYTSYSDGRIASFKPGYNELGKVSDEEFEKKVKEYNAAVTEIISKAGINSIMSQYDIELRLHNALVEKLEYKSASNAHNSYGALVENVAVCQGYTLSFNYLLRLCGIEAHYVSGYSNGVPHAWSLVFIDGNYYYTDLTWDDPSGAHQGCHEIFHSYFNVTENILKLDHTFDELPYALPVCDSVIDSYYEHNPERIMGAEPDVKLVASFFKNGSASVYVPTEYEDSFTAWYFANIREIAALAGYDMSQGISYLYTRSNNEYHLIIEGVLPEPEIIILPGDVDGDGKISAIDSNTLRRILSGSIFPSEINIEGGDIDKDGKLSSIDSNLLRRLIAGS